MEELFAKLEADFAQILVGAKAEFAAYLGGKVAVAKEEGFADGLKAGAVGEKIYSQAELDTVVANKLAEAQADVNFAVAEAVSAKVAEMVADFEATQIDDAAFLAKYKK